MNACDRDEKEKDIQGKLEYKAEKSSISEDDKKIYLPKKPIPSRDYPLPDRKTKNRVLKIQVLAVDNKIKSKKLGLSKKDIAYLVSF